MINFLIAAGTLTCAVLAVRENRLLISALWLALTSALVSFLMYRLGAAEVAVVELSVGAGLVTVLFVFAINISGSATVVGQVPVPRPLAWVAVVMTGLLLAWMILPSMQLERFAAVLEQQGQLAGLFRSVLWKDRSVDSLLQVVLIFAGVLAVLGLIGKDDELGQKKEEVQ
jgi:uncharacterized MnhB-related membrane protein